MTEVTDRYNCRYCKETDSTPERPLLPYFGSDHSVAYSFHEDCQLAELLPTLEDGSVGWFEAMEKIAASNRARIDALLIKSAVLGEQLKQDQKNVAELMAKMDAAGVAYQ